MAVNGKAIARAFTSIGPYAAQAAALLKDNPEIRGEVQKQASRLFATRKNGRKGLLGTIEALREPVAYLTESADDADEARRAQAWAKRLDDYEHAALLLKSAGATRSEKAELAAQVNTLRSEIFSAFIAEQAEDAQDGENR